MKIAGSATQGGNQLPTGMQVGMGVKEVSVHKFFSQGSFESTGNPLDIAIEGQGFFLVDRNGEDAFTRSGAFKLDSDGRLVTSNGYPLQPEFTVPAEAVNIVVSEDGHIAALDKNGEELSSADITIYDFINEPGLNAVGKNLYVETEASGAPIQGTPGEDNFGTLSQGYLEGSNVELVDEMVGLIVGQRAYETNSKAITTSDSMLQTAINVKR